VTVDHGGGRGGRALQTWAQRRNRRAADYGGTRSLHAAAPPLAGSSIDDAHHFHHTGNMEEQDAVTALAALAQGMRLRIFRALVGAGPQGMTPGALSATLGVPGSTLSFHLKELTHSGLVTQEREGRHLIYRPAIDRMNALLDYLSAHCCHGEGCEAVPASRQVAC
jgi:ArsR family transcriptional regulator